jgi:hypothetical protein
MKEPPTNGAMLAVTKQRSTVVDAKNLDVTVPRSTLNVTDRMSVIVATSFGSKRNMQLATSEITTLKGNNLNTASILHLIVRKFFILSTLTFFDDKLRNHMPIFPSYKFVAKFVIAVLS